MSTPEFLTKVFLVVGGWSWWFNGFCSGLCAFCTTSILLLLSFGRDERLRQRKQKRFSLNFGEMWLVAFCVTFAVMSFLGHLISKTILTFPQILASASLQAGAWSVLSIMSETVANVLVDAVFGSDEW